MQLVDKYMQKYSISLAIKEMQIKLHWDSISSQSE
jgi:hypothetical protein